MSNGVVWRTLRRRFRRAKRRRAGRTGTSVEPEVQQNASVGWNWNVTEAEAIEAQPAQGSSAASAPSVHAVEYRADPGPAIKARRPLPSSGPDFERMADELLHLGGTKRGRSGSGAEPVRTDRPDDGGGSEVEVDSASEPPAVDNRFAIPLCGIAGLGATVAARLASAGIASVGALASVPDDEVDDLAAIIGTFPARVRGWVDRARDPAFAAPPAILEPDQH